MNSAESWVENWKLQKGQEHSESGRFINFMSHAGKIDVFLFSSHISPKETQRKLNTLTGFTPLPAWYSLGFHYSKWE
jgi:alpha-glucosidase (family GH31 glycosyl hydrolase)